MLAELYSESYARNPNPIILKKVTKDEKLKNTPTGKLLQRIEFLAEFSEFKKKVQAQKLDSASDRKLVASIKARATLLNQLEARTKQTIDTGDWTSQLVSIDTLAKESQRFYQELISAPVPKGLNEEEEQQYLNLLSTQASPFQLKATEAQQKVEMFWTDSQWLPALKTSWEQKPLRNIVALELAALREIAPENKKASLATFKTGTTDTIGSVAAAELSAKHQAARPTMQDMQAARRRVYQEPLNPQAVQQLMDLEKKSDNIPMVQYLQTRLETMNQNLK